MKIIKLVLKNYRNYDDLEILFNDKLNIIIGDNAQGKTNILEAIYFNSITKSFLGVNEKTLIKNNKNFLSVKSNIKSFNINKNLSILLNNENKKLEINKKEIKKHSDYIGNLKIIIFSPDNIRIIKDGPAIRRKFLNIEISQLYNKYLKILSEYNLVVKQRNEYLKIIRNENYNQDYFDILNNKFCDLAVDIYKYRNDFLEEINKVVDRIYFEISNESGLHIVYHKNIDIDEKNIMKENLLNKLENSFLKEKIYGSTIVGPHRDDFSFYLNDIDLSLYGSQGQNRMAVLALKLAEIEVFNKISGEYPILLLDDIFSELDVNKRNKLINYLNKDIQTIITTTDLNNIDDNFTKKASIFKIKNGKIIENNN